MNEEKKINSVEARANFSEIINTVYYANEPVIVSRRKKEIVAIIPISEYKKNKSYKMKDK